MCLFNKDYVHVTVTNIMDTKTKHGPCSQIAYSFWSGPNISDNYLEYSVISAVIEARYTFLWKASNHRRQMPSFIFRESIFGKVLTKRHRNSLNSWHMEWLLPNIMGQSALLGQRWERSSCRGSEVMNPTSIHEDVVSILGPAQWVKDLVLLWAVV